MQDLRKKLQRLHELLGQTEEAGDPELRRELIRVQADIQALLTRAEKDGPEQTPAERAEKVAPPESLPERLRAALTQFEDTHPSTVAAAEEVIEALARLGL